MSDTFQFPSLAGAAATIETLHWYAKGVGSIPRALGTVNEAFAHPKWWHISLRVVDEGLTTLAMPLRDGLTFKLVMDLTAHVVRLTSSSGHQRAFSMTAGKTAIAFAEQIAAAIAADHGLVLALDKSKFANEAPRPYDPTQAGAFLQAVKAVNAVFAEHVAAVSEDFGPIQLWPHGFDVAVEFFGTRKVKHEEHGKVTEYPSQLNLGFSPGEPNHPEPYFYSNPWPFEVEALKDVALPAGQWRLDPAGWQGSLLEYSDVVAADDGAAVRGAATVRAFARAVYDAAAPTLTA